MEKIKDVNRQKGGIARAESLTKEQRSDIARKAALVRWDPEIQTATHYGDLKIGELSISCAVLPDGRRVLSQRGVSKALGRRHGGKDFKNREASEGGGLLPIFLSPKNLKPFISSELEAVASSPILFASGNQTAHGMEASLLPKICEVWMDARNAGVLSENQRPIATRAEMLLRSFASLGVIALVDEATGYQEIRDRHALQAILDKFLKAELAAWAKKFPDEFYQQMFRLHNWEWKGMKVNRPQVVGKFTKDIVYERLAPDIISELEKRNPLQESGRRRAKHHQWLSDDIGHPALAQHLHAVIGLMRVSDSWTQFKDLLDRGFPKKGQTLRFL